MTYLDGIHAGLYVLGVLTPLLAVALLVLAARLADMPHRVRVAKLRRQAQRDGRRSPAAAELYAQGGVVNSADLGPTLPQNWT